MVRVHNLLTLYFLASILTLFLPSCAFKNCSKSNIVTQKKKIPLFISMPQNPLAFNDISAQLYDALYAHYNNVGYIMVNTKNNGYTLRVRIKGLEPHQKLVSPDIVLMHSYVNLDLECELLNFNQEVVERKHFAFSTLVSKPRNPVLVSNFITHTYEKLLFRSIPKIERYFRPLLLKIFSES